MCYYLLPILLNGWATPEYMKMVFQLFPHISSNIDHFPSRKNEWILTWGL